eukprot:gene12028-8281_t
MDKDTVRHFFSRSTHCSPEVLDGLLGDFARVVDDFSLSMKAAVWGNTEQERLCIYGGLACRKHFLPVQIWLTHQYPIDPPMIFAVGPLVAQYQDRGAIDVTTCVFPGHPNVDHTGVCYCSALAEWSPRSSSLTSVIQQFIKEINANGFPFYVTLNNSLSLCSCPAGTPAAVDLVPQTLENAPFFMIDHQQEIPLLQPIWDSLCVILHVTNRQHSSLTICHDMVSTTQSSLSLSIYQYFCWAGAITRVLAITHTFFSRSMEGFHVFHVGFTGVAALTSEDVVHLPPPAKGITRFVVCQDYRPGAGNEGSCPYGDRCNFVHLKNPVESYAFAPVHMNLRCPSVGCARYPRVDGSNVILCTVLDPRCYPECRVVVPVWHCLETAAFAPCSRRRHFLLCHDFSCYGYCPMASRCRRVHVVTVDSSAASACKVVRPKPCAQCLACGPPAPTVPLQKPFPYPTAHIEVWRAVDTSRSSASATCIRKVFLYNIAGMMGMCDTCDGRPCCTLTLFLSRHLSLSVGTQKKRGSERSTEKPMGELLVKEEKMAFLMLFSVLFFHEKFSHWFLYRCLCYL